MRFGHDCRKAEETRDSSHGAADRSLAGRRVELNERGNEGTVRVCAGLLYRRGCVFLGKRAASRSSYPGVWDMPGGHCEQGEAAEETLVRELREEIGVTPTEAARVATFHIPGPADGGIDLQVYVVTAWEGEPRNLLHAEHDEVGWFTIDQACRLRLASAEYPVLFRRLL